MMRASHRIPSRGQAEMLEWFPRLMLLLVAIVVIVMLVRVYTNRDVESAPLQRSTHLYRLYYDDIIMYRDSATGRVYPGIVDMEKFTNERLSSVFVERAESYATGARLIATPMGGCAISQAMISHNNKTLDLAPFSTSVEGKGGASTETVTFPVTLKRGGLECAGTLNITVVRPNS